MCFTHSTGSLSLPLIDSTLLIYACSHAAVLSPIIHRFLNMDVRLQLNKLIRMCCVHCLSSFLIFHFAARHLLSYILGVFIFGAIGPLQRGLFLLFFFYIFHLDQGDSGTYWMSVFYSRNWNCTAPQLRSPCGIYDRMSVTVSSNALELILTQIGMSQMGFLCHTVARRRHCHDFSIRFSSG